VSLSKEERFPSQTLFIALGADQYRCMVHRTDCLLFYCRFPISRDAIYSINWPNETATYKGLIERAQFALNPKMYEHGGFKELSDQGFDGTWLEWFLKETETFHGT
jgi:hypothetical protein